MAKKQFTISDLVDNATDFTNLKDRLRTAFQILEKHFDDKSDFHFVDKKTNTDPSQYKAGDVVIDSSIYDDAIVIYAFDAKKNKIPLSLKSLAGTLPCSYNEIFIGNGSTFIFNTQVPFEPGTTQVYLAGARQRLGSSGQYTENASTYKQIQFGVIPANGAVIVVDYEMKRIL